MADIARHNTAGIKINGVIESAIIAESVQVTPNIQDAILYAGGDALPTFGGTLANTPVMQFQTHNIGLVTSPQIITTGFLVSMRACSDTFGPGSGYIGLSFSKGLIVPVSLEASAGAPATLTIAVYGASSDGDTNPLTVDTTAAALGVHTGAYTIGTLSLGSAIGGVQSLSLNYNYEVKNNVSENGKTYPTVIYSDRQQTQLSASVSALSAASAARLNTAEALTSNLIMTFRKVQEGGVVTDTGQMTVTAAKSIIKANAQGGMPSMVQIEATPIYDGVGNDYLTIAA